MEELKGRLAQLCASRGWDRFQPEEMVELLADGESVEWICGQLLPAGSADQELAALLAEIAALVAPATAPEPQAEAEFQAEAEPAPPAEGADQLPDLATLKGMALPPGMDAAQLQRLLRSPQGELLTDFGAFCQERGVDADGQQEGLEEKLRELHEEWLQEPRQSLGGKRPAELLEGGRLFPQKVETYRREAPKVGRNDPCPCGSGLKYKKCCGKAA